jgi:hypothetical protein
MKTPHKERKFPPASWEGKFALQILLLLVLEKWPRAYD